jgi:DNA-binding transcriptional regulator YhcF (GntR family)
MTSATPIYVQLRNQIVMGIGQGELKIGQGLPTVRQMAEDIGVNTMTVNKTYAILKSEGYIEIDRRRGATVSPKADTTGRFREKTENELMLLSTEAALKGMGRGEFMDMCAGLYGRLNVSYAGGQA